MDIDPVFFEEFTAWFHADLIDADDQEKLREAAHFCASALSQRANPDDLINYLSGFLKAWHQDMIMRCIEATDVDWLADEEEEGLLKYIVTEITDGLKYYSQNRSAFKRA